LAIAPSVEVLDHQQAQEDFTGCGVATGNERQRLAPSHGGTDLPIEVIVFQEAIKLLPHRIGVLGEFWHTSKNVFRGRAIDEHGSTGGRGM
jgi:hypothetical protein